MHYHEAFSRYCKENDIVTSTRQVSFSNDTFIDIVSTNGKPLIFYVPDWMSV